MKLDFNSSSATSVLNRNKNISLQGPYEIIQDNVLKALKIVLSLQQVGIH
jgi:hypothetical protein